MKLTEQDSTFDLTPAEEMEAEERELVIENSVDDLVTYADHPLSDHEIENKRLHLEDIKPEPEDE
ncbi:MAG: hypothetical protein Q4D78_03005 [Neisseria zoodegmatis]|uniref:hypothetical protein n=1 Tax=Neisseria zoodegmatis TaxID=326523 RepID=UPI0026F13EF9|nr:hypothetical protein [Neisseria zoodegmatis]MDO5069158.1 hypothetical protein [Neisseria zoodegmatis]